MDALILVSVVGFVGGCLLGILGVLAVERVRVWFARWDVRRARRELDRERDFRRHADSAMGIVHDTSPRRLGRWSR